MREVELVVVDGVDRDAYLCAGRDGVGVDEETRMSDFTHHRGGNRWCYSKRFVDGGAEVVA